MYIIGLTGGVGSGKTEAAKLLREIAKAELILADELGHTLMEKGSTGYQKVVDTFGKEILREDASIDRKKLAAVVFQEEEKLKELNQIIHPLVLGAINEYCQQKRRQKGILILESAIMFESGCDKLCDEVWYVFVPEEVRMKRLAASRGYSEEKSKSVIQKQMSEEEYRNRCQFEIVNDGSFAMLRRRLQDALQERKIDIGF